MCNAVDVVVVGSGGGGGEGVVEINVELLSVHLQTGKRSPTVIRVIVFFIFIVDTPCDILFFQVPIALFIVSSCHTTPILTLALLAGELEYIPQILFNIRLSLTNISVQYIFCDKHYYQTILTPPAHTTSKLLQ